MICPFCLASAAIAAGSTAGSGGVVALVGTLLLKKPSAKIQTNKKEVRHGDSSTGHAA